MVYPFGVPYDVYPLVHNRYHTLYSKSNELFENTFNAGYMMPTPIIHDKNTIRLDPPFPNHVDSLLVCMLGYDSDFTNISPAMIKPLCDMGIYATQMFIYKELKIDVDQAYIEGGSELGAFKELIESYSDAKEKFQEALMKFRGASNFDKETTLAYFSLINP
jgi:hypothetical protein